MFSAVARYTAAQRTDRGFICRKYLLGESVYYDESMVYVPEGCIYVEEWRKGSEVRRRLIYEREEITPYLGDPFEPVKKPWSWISDVSTDVNLTTAVERYFMPGNEIRLELILMFIREHDDMDIRYIDSASGEEILFPNQGVSIEVDGST